MTAFIDIATAIVAKLQEAPPIAGGRVYRGRPWPMPEAVDSMVWVHLSATESERVLISGAPLDWRTSYEVEIRARYSPDTQAPDDAVDAIIAEVFSRLAAFSMNGVEDIIPGTSITWDDSETDENLIGASFAFEVVHRTLSTQLTAP